MSIPFSFQNPIFLLKFWFKNYAITFHTLPYHWHLSSIISFKSMKRQSKDKIELMHISGILVEECLVFGGFNTFLNGCIFDNINVNINVNTSAFCYSLLVQNSCTNLKEPTKTHKKATVITVYCLLFTVYCAHCSLSWFTKMQHLCDPVN